MNEKIINVYYGSDNLPYKDIERQVHFPICGNAFLGASNTTKIRFYYDYIGDNASTYVSVAKLPNGKQGSQVLSKSSDENGNYVELELSNWYTQAKGDVYIALQGYSGGVEYEYDDETQLYEIHGTPTIQTTGSIKLAINYAPIGDSADYNDEFTTYQEILAALGDKVDKLSTNGTWVYTHTGSSQGQIGTTKNVVGSSVVMRDENGQLLVSETPTLNNSAVSKKYVDDSVASAVSSVYKYKGSVATYEDLPSSDLTIGDVYNVEDTGDNYAWTGTTWDKLAGDVDLSSYYTKSDVDSLLANKQNTLVSGVNIKTINSNSLLGTGNIEIDTSGGAWGEITGDIQDQTDLQNELQDIREVAEGKCDSIVVSYQATAPANDGLARQYKKPDGTAFTSLSDFNSYVSGLFLENSYFNSQDDILLIDTNGYIISDDKVVYKGQEVQGVNVNPIAVYFKTGDIFLVKEIDVPDRWVNSAILCKLETSKVDLTNYATKTELATKSDLTNIAPTYDDTLTYTIGEVVIYNGKLYRCTTAITQAESWDSTHWEQVSVASDFVNLTGTQVISGEKTFTNGLIVNDVIKLSANNNHNVLDIYNQTTQVYTFSNYSFTTGDNGVKDLGYSSRKWKDFYLAGIAYLGSGTQLTQGSDGSLQITLSADDKSLRPSWSEHYNLGTAGYKWKDLYLSGKVIFDTGYDIYKYSTNIVFDINGTGYYQFSQNRAYLNVPALQLGTSPVIKSMENTTYGLALPDTTSYTANKTIATTDQAFNVINASDITNNTLTQEQFDIVTNGKPTIISGTYWGYDSPILLSLETTGTVRRGFFVGANNFGMFFINTSNLQINIINSSQQFGYLRSIYSFNGKPIPSYPSDTGTFNLQMVNGTMSWNEQWVGTQAQYDALASVDSNTTYYIIED